MRRLRASPPSTRLHCRTSPPRRTPPRVPSEPLPSFTRVPRSPVSTAAAFPSCTSARRAFPAVSRGVLPLQLAPPDSRSAALLHPATRTSAPPLGASTPPAAASIGRRSAAPPRPPLRCFAAPPHAAGLLPAATPPRAAPPDASKPTRRCSSPVSHRRPQIGPHRHPPHGIKQSHTKSGCADISRIILLSAPKSCTNLLRAPRILHMNYFCFSVLSLF